MQDTVGLVFEPPPPPLNFGLDVSPITIYKIFLFQQSYFHCKAMVFTPRVIIALINYMRGPRKFPHGVPKNFFL